jgi:hypothetical protein
MAMTKWIPSATEGQSVRKLVDVVVRFESTSSSALASMLVRMPFDDVLSQVAGRARAALAADPILVQVVDAMMEPSLAFTAGEPQEAGRDAWDVPCKVYVYDATKHGSNNPAAP